MNQQTFKQYLDSRSQLITAAASAPIATTSYTITKYGAIPVVEDVNNQVHNSLAVKPKQTLIVEWRYITPDTPVPLSVKLDQSEDSYTPSWTSDKLQRWIDKNTTFSFS